jgi:hypothetical protein
MSNVQYLILFASAAFLGYVVGRLQGDKEIRRAKLVDEISRDFFNATMRQVDVSFREEGLDFDEEKFVEGVRKRSGIKIEKVVKKA